MVCSFLLLLESFPSEDGLATGMLLFYEPSGDGYHVWGKCYYKVNGSKVYQSFDAYLDANGDVTDFNMY